MAEQKAEYVTTNEIMAGLAKPFRKDEELTREQNNKTFTYAQIQSYEQRLDEIVGLDGWQCRYEFGPNGEILCYLGIRFEDKWIWKSDGAGQTNFEKEKGGLTDAFKRACKRFGLGRYFYWGDSPPKTEKIKHIWKKEHHDLVVNNAPSINPEQYGVFLDMSGMTTETPMDVVEKYCKAYQGHYEEHGKKGGAMNFAKETIK